MDGVNLYHIAIISHNFFVRKGSGIELRIEEINEVKFSFE